MTPEKSLLICCSPRCGSTWLCDMIAATGELGVPSEAFSAVQGEYYDRILGRIATSHYSAVFDVIVRRGSTRNRVFSTKLFWDFLGLMAAAFHAQGEHTDLDGFGILNVHLRNVSALRLRRADVLRQAISLHRAAQTNVWWKNPTVPVDESTLAAFDYRKIAALRTKLERDEARWDARLADWGGPICDIEYGAFCADPYGAMCRLAEFTGCPSLLAALERGSAFAVQSDAMTDAWVAEFQRISAARAVADAV